MAFNKFSLAAFGVVWFLAIPFCRAATSPVGSLEDRVATSSGWSKLGVEWNGWMHGSSVANMDGRKPNADGSPGAPVEMVHQVAITYPSNIGMDFAVVPNFSFRPFLSNSEAAAFELKDPSIGISGTLWETGGWRLWSRFENALPLSSASREAGMVLSAGMYTTLAYRFPSSGWEGQALIQPSVSLMSNGELQSYLFFSPRLSYRFKSDWALFGYLETATQTERAAGLLNFTSAQDSHVGVGLSYSFAEMYIEPAINVFPFGESPGSSMFVSLFFGGKLK